MFPELSPPESCHAAIPIPADGKEFSGSVDVYADGYMRIRTRRRVYYIQQNQTIVWIKFEKCYKDIANKLNI